MQLKKIIITQQVSVIRTRELYVLTEDAQKIATGLQNGEISDPSCIPWKTEREDVTLESTEAYDL